jgi:aldehyde dehydrogenase (NAD+)
LETLDVENPATELVVGKIALGSAADVDRAVKAARVAFAAWSRTSREERLEVLNRVVTEYEKRFGDWRPLSGRRWAPLPHCARTLRCR